VADGDRVRKISAADGKISAFAGNGTDGYSGDGGPASAAQLSGPVSLAVDQLNNVYIAEGNNACVRRVAVDGTISTVVGNGGLAPVTDGQPASAPISFPSSVGVDNTGTLYVWVGNVYRVSGGVLTRVAGGGQSAPADGLIANTVGFPSGFAAFAVDSSNAYNAFTLVEPMLTSTADGNGIGELINTPDCELAKELCH